MECGNVVDFRYFAESYEGPVLYNHVRTKGMMVGNGGFAG
jgi:hypothetical protein